MRAARSLRRKLAIGYAVFGALIAMKIVEYFIGTRVHSGGWVYLLVLALVGVWLIAYYFMHINQLRHSQGRDDD